MRFLKLLTFAVFIGSTASGTVSLKWVDKGRSKADTTAYTVVQVPPKFPGGKVAMLAFIQNTSTYPVNFEKGPLVLLRLLIEKDGSISKVETAYAEVNEEFIQEAKRIVRMMPKWLPGSQDGRILRVYATVFVRFRTAKKI